MSELKNTFTTAFPDLAPSLDAKSRAVDLARIADAQGIVRQHGRSRLRMGLGVGFASAAVVATMLLVPSNSAAAYLRHIRQRITDAKSAHMIDWNVGKDGKRVKSREVWYQDGKWRLESTLQGESTITDGEKKWVYAQRQALVRVSADGELFTNGPSGFKISSMIADAGGKSKLKIVDEGTFDRVTMFNPIDNSSFTVWVDKKTDYPVRGRVEALTPNGPILLETFEFEFNKAIPATTFAPVFPAGTKVVDESEGKAYWEAELSKRLAVFEVPKGAHSLMHAKAVIRNIQVANNGDIFVLYSGEVTPESLELADDLGNVYAHCDTFQPDMSDTSGNHVRGIVVDGDKLNGVWFTPVRTQTLPWKPRKFTLSASEHWFRADTEKMKHWPKGVPVTDKDMIPMSTPLGSITLSVEGPTCSAVPDYMPYMGIGPQGEFDVRQADDLARFRYLHFRERYAEAEPYLRDEIAITEKHEQENGQRWVQSQSFYMMYLNLKLQGRRPEAREWLKKVLDEPGGPGSDPNIENALRAEGLD